MSLWTVESEPEVEQWLASFPPSLFAIAAFRVDGLSTQGSVVRMPHSRSLGEGLFELRFDLDRTARRITFFFPGGPRIVLLTTFHKQRSNERTEVTRAREAMRRRVEEGHTAEGEGNMARTSWTELKSQKLGAMDADERAEYERAYAEAQLAAEVGARIQAAREAADLDQGELACCMGTNQAAIDRLESGDVGVTLATLQRVAGALGLTVNVELRPTA